MKVKLDYVTNSSSVCFYFAFKGKTIDDLIPLLKKYRENFDLQSDLDTSWNCNVNDIIKDIQSLPEHEDYTSRHMLCPNIIKKEFQRHLDQLSAYYPINDFLARFIKKYKKRIHFLEKAEKRNMKRCIVAEWGDSDGDFVGPTGVCMDHVAGDLVIDEKDLIVFTVNEH